MNYNGADLDAIFGALANADRRRMIDLLSLQPASIQQLAHHVGMSLPAIHRHITVLEASGLVQRKKSGRTNFLALDRSTMRRFQEWAMRYDTTWGTDAETLENYVAAMQATDSEKQTKKARER
jgi:DNA-binding transcriptional ArsR family regulator